MFAARAWDIMMLDGPEFLFSLALALLAELDRCWRVRPELASLASDSNDHDDAVVLALMAACDDIKALRWRLRNESCTDVASRVLAAAAEIKIVPRCQAVF